MNRALVFVVIMIGAVKMSKGTCDNFLTCVRTQNPNSRYDVSTLTFQYDDAANIKQIWNVLCRYKDAVITCLSTYSGDSCSQITGVINPSFPKTYLSSQLNFLCTQTDVAVDLVVCLRKPSVLSKVQSCLQSFYQDSDGCSTYKKCNEDALSDGGCSTKAANFLAIGTCGGSKFVIKQIVLVGLFIVTRLFTK